MNIKDKITFFYAIEEKLWDEKVNANKYLATMCILCMALLGAWHTAGGFLAATLDWHTEMSVFHAIMLSAYIWVLTIAESILACTDLKTVVLRSLLMLVSIALAYIAGVVLGTIAIIIVCFILFIFGCRIVLGMFDKSITGGPKWKTDDGDIVTGEKQWGSDVVHGDDGKDYKMKDPWGM